MIAVHIVSFSYKSKESRAWIDGLPVTKPLIVDLRKKLPNPWHEPELRKLTGKDPAVKQFLQRCPKTQAQLDNILSFVNLMSYLHYQCYICLGCTGGKHRSVALAELAAEDLKVRAADIISTVTVEHLDFPSPK